MTREKRGVRQIKTISGVLDRRRSRTSAGALLELSMLESERMRLDAEIARSNRRCEEIRKRLDEISDKEKRLHAFVENPKESAAQPEIHSPHAFKSKRLSY